jgi:hypothetical protein
MTWVQANSLGYLYAALLIVTSAKIIGQEDKAGFMISDYLAAPPGIHYVPETDQRTEKRVHTVFDGL